MRPRDALPDRRRFLAWSSAAAFLSAHHRLLGAGPTPRGREGSGPRILGLELRTAAPLARMKAFYHGTLGLGVLDEAPDRLALGAGETRLTFVPAGPGDGEPFYHFAFNIPENKIVSARDWQRARTPLLPIPGRLRDPAFPDDVVGYRHWNAHSVFFFDPSGNVVEYIARHDLANARPGGFDSGDILYASEIALVSDDVLATASGLEQAAGVDRYKGASPQFAALGDEHGLLLVMGRGRVISFDAPEEKAVSVFPTSAAVRGGRGGSYRVPGYPYEISFGG